MRVVEPFVEMARGLWTTLRMMIDKPVTVQYPEQKKPVKPRFRGRHDLQRQRLILGKEFIVSQPYLDVIM